MKDRKLNIGNVFLASALIMLAFALCFGIISSIIYIKPNFLKTSIGFDTLRPMHVSSAMFWIILGACGALYNGVCKQQQSKYFQWRAVCQWLLWIIAIIGIFFSYSQKQFGGREYWEFNPVWAFPIAIAWILFLWNFISIVKNVRNWPVYMWMWMTGIVFFLFTFIENYLWLIPYFRQHFITDTTIQWKVNGSLVGSWNQILYATAFFLMDKISGNQQTGKSKFAFAMYFLGISNLMFNWGHHIYTLPTESYIRYFGYIVSMTEWIFFIKIIYDWRKSIDGIRLHFHQIPFKFLMAADIWAFLNLGQAIGMSIPAINLFTHGTHVTVAHAMGTTIGINSMIILAACFYFFKYISSSSIQLKIVSYSYWTLQISLLIFWVSLNLAGIQRWQMSEHRTSYSVMMQSLQPYFITFVISGIGLLISILFLIVLLWMNFVKKKLYWTQ